MLCSKVSTAELKGLVNFGLDSLIKVKIVMGVSEDQQRIQLDSFDQLPGVDVATVPLDSNLNQILKRMFDVAFSVVFCLVILSWLLPIVAILIKLDSKGPVFFIQLRNGLGNNPFKCLKFRSMVVSKDEFKQATKNDSRITTIGRFLRKSSIDELPQFINVLIGDMSVIGPPTTSYQVERKVFQPDR